MTLTIEATYENGVFVPLQRPILAEKERVRLVIETLDTPSPSQTKPDPFKNHKRIQIDPELALEIAISPEFLPEES